MCGNNACTYYIELGHFVLSQKLFDFRHTGAQIAASKITPRRGKQIIRFLKYPPFFSSRYNLCLGRCSPGAATPNFQYLSEIDLTVLPHKYPKSGVKDVKSCINASPAIKQGAAKTDYPFHRENGFLRESLI